MVKPSRSQITGATVRADFNDPLAVVHYTRAAHFLGLWKSELSLIERFLPDRAAPLLEAGCGSGRVTLGLWDLGFRHITAFDFAEELLDQARHLARDRHLYEAQPGAERPLAHEFGVESDARRPLPAGHGFGELVGMVDRERPGHTAVYCEDPTAMSAPPGEGGVGGECVACPVTRA